MKFLVVIHEIVSRMSGDFRNDFQVVEVEGGPSDITARVRELSKTVEGRLIVQAVTIIE